MKTDIARKRVLIVDDFAQMRSTLKQMLQSLGVSDIDLAANGREAVEALARASYDIVLCDYNLGPGKDGQQVLEEAKHRRLIRYSTIFVMITAENTMDMVMGAMEYRPDDYLTKPFNKGLLRSRLERLLERKSNLDTIERAMAKGETETAIRLCDERIARQPRHSGELLRLKGELALASGNLDLAERVYREVLELRSVPWATIGLGRVHFEQGDLAAARALFEEVVEKHKTAMEAYDWLARIMEREGDERGAQAMLEKATALSPKAIRRQQSLAELASRNQDFAAAERAFRKAVTLGRDSVFRSADHYTGLARAQAENGSGMEALKTLHGLRKEFRDDHEVALKASLTEGRVFHAIGETEQAKRALVEAGQHLEAVGGAHNISPEVAVAMAEGLLLSGDEAGGMALMQDVIRNNHDDERLLSRVQAGFDAAGLSAQGQEAIRTTAGEVVSLNNRGVGLVKQGDLEEAIGLFDEALASMGESRIVNLNAAQALLLSMQRTGPDKGRIDRAGRCLEKVAAQDAGNPTLRKLRDIHAKLKAQLAD